MDLSPIYDQFDSLSDISNLALSGQPALLKSLLPIIHRFDTSSGLFYIFVHTSRSLTIHVA